MNRKTSACAFLILTSLLQGLASTTARAEVANLDEARQVCENWLTYIVQQRGAWAGSTEPVIVTEEAISVGGPDLAYCYNIAPEGWVVVPALKELPPIKACSERGYLDPAEADGLPAMLVAVLAERTAQYVAVYGSMEAAQDPNDPKVFEHTNREAWSTFELPEGAFAQVISARDRGRYIEGDALLSTEWHQDAPFNDLCPEGACEDVVDAGAAAVAMAQIMKFHNWPPNGRWTKNYDWAGEAECGDLACTCPGGGADCEGLILSVDYTDDYDWANMPDECNDGGDCAANEEAAVAELVYEAGVSVRTRYGNCGSMVPSANLRVQRALGKFFYYNRDTEIINRMDYSRQSWFFTMQAEVDGNRPVFYTVYEHHAVCDGWRWDSGSDLYQIHMNYGWNDGNTAWYSLDGLVCTPSDPQPDECTSDAEQALIGIYPNFRGYAKDNDKETIEGLRDAFNDDVIGGQWALVELDSGDLSVIEANGHLGFSGSGGGATDTIAALYANGWALSLEEGIHIKARYRFEAPGDASSKTALFLGLILDPSPCQTTTYDFGIEASVGHDGSTFFRGGEGHIYGRVQDDFETLGVSPLEGWLYVRYRVVADALEFSTVGFDFPMYVVNNVKETSGADRAIVCLGAKLQGATTLNPNDAYFDRFAVKKGIVVDPPVLRSAPHATYLGREANNRFGESVASAGDVNGDGVEDLIIGTPRHDQNGTNSGKATVYSGVTGGRLFEFIGATIGDRLGHAVAAAGDVNLDGYDDVIVGAPYWGPDNHGAAYVFSGYDGEQLFAFTGEALGDQFGFAVAGDEALDNRPGPDLIIGAPKSNANGNNSGAAYVFSGETGVLKKRKSGRNAGDNFGWAVTGIDVVNGGVAGGWAVSAPKHDREGTNTGAVYIFHDVVQEYSRLHTLYGATERDWFGYSLARAGWNAVDGREDLYIGAPYAEEIIGSDEVGRVYLYNASAGALITTSEGEEEGDRYGSAIAGGYDVDDDGTADIIIGAPGHDGPNGEDAGRVYLRSGEHYTEIDIWDGAEAGDEFGTAVSGIADLDGDDRAEMIMGAPLNDTIGTDAGRVYVLNPITRLVRPSCPEDLNGRGGVDAEDLQMLLNAWGEASIGQRADLDGKDGVGQDDLLKLLRRWGDPNCR